MYFTDETRYEYSSETRLWRKINKNIDLSEKMLSSSHDDYKVLVGGKPIDKVIRPRSSDKNQNDQQLLDLISKLEFHED